MMLSRSADGIKEYKALSAQDQANNELLVPGPTRCCNSSVKQTRSLYLRRARRQLFEIILTQWFWLMKLMTACCKLKVGLNRPNDPRLLEGLVSSLARTVSGKTLKTISSALKVLSAKIRKGTNIPTPGCVWHALGDGTGRHDTLRRRSLSGALSQKLRGGLGFFQLIQDELDRGNVIHIVQ